MYHQNVYQISEGNVIFFARKSQKRPFLCLKKPSVWWYAGDTFWYEMQLMVVNRAGAGQGYQIQATRWRELSLLLGTWWEIFNMSIFVTEMYHQGETKLLTSMVLSCSFLKCLTEKKSRKATNLAFFLFLLWWSNTGRECYCLTRYWNVSPKWYKGGYDLAG